MNLMQVIRRNDIEHTLWKMRKHARENNYSTHEVDKKQLEKLDKYQRRYLKGWVCWGCDMPLDRAGCGAYGGAPPCPWRARIKRRANRLKQYKPRYSRRKA